MSNCVVVKSELDENVDDKRMSLPSRISLVEKEISLMYKLNRSGPRINPWGTPEETRVLSEITPFTITC